MPPREFHRRRWQALTIWVVIFTVLTASNLYRVREAAHRNHALVACITGWANSTTHRTSTLTAFAAKRQNALDTLIQAVALHKPQLFNQALTNYLEAAGQYREQAREHPIPPSPQLVC